MKQTKSRLENVDIRLREAKSKIDNLKNKLKEGDGFVKTFESLVKTLPDNLVPALHPETQTRTGCRTPLLQRPVHCGQDLFLLKS